MTTKTTGTTNDAGVFPPHPARLTTGRQGLTQAQQEAIAWADAYTSDTGLPTYSALLEILEKLKEKS